MPSIPRWPPTSSATASTGSWSATGKAFATGYYEPEIRGSRTPAPGYATPIYRTPPDLIRCTRADGGTGRGRIDESGQCVFYYTRAEIEAGALAGRGLEIGYAADPIDLFFLQIQGSGRLIQPDGSVMRIGYDNQNGREYVAIGRLLRARGVLQPGAAGMKEIVAWMRANPEEGAALMRENLSYIFFKELTGPGPLGALALPVTPRGDGRDRPQFRAAGRAGVPRHGPRRGRRAVGRAGHRRGDQGREPLRHLLGRGRGRPKSSPAAWRRTAAR